MARLSFLLLALLIGPLAAADVTPFAGAEIKDARAPSETGRQRIVLGALQKINNQVKPEDEIIVNGSRQETIYALPGIRDLDAVTGHYVRELGSTSDLMFRCDGRGCGSSNFWANTIFGDRILYGPEQYQRYLVGRDKRDGSYQYVYIGQRGTREIYVLVGTITVSGSVAAGQAQVIAKTLVETGRYVMPGDFPEEAVHDLADAIRRVAGRFAIVAHHPVGQSPDTLEAALQRSDAAAREARDRLVEAGVAPAMLLPFAAGPMAPSELYPPVRLEIVLVQRRPGSAVELQQR